MAIPSRQIGWSQESNLLWNISKQLERLSGVMGSIPVSSSSVEFYANLASFPAVGSSTVIYVAEDTELIYRWDGAAYVELSSSGTAPAANIYTYTGSPVLNPYFAASIEANNYFSISGVVYGPYNIYSAINTRNGAEPYITSLTFNYSGISTINLSNTFTPALLSASYPNLVVISEGPISSAVLVNSITIISTVLTTFSAPLLLYCNNGININGSALTSINLNSLASVNAGITFQNTVLTAISLPSLLICGTLTIQSNTLLASISLPVITSITNIQISGIQSNFTTFNLPLIQYIGIVGSGSISILTQTALTTFSFGTSLKAVGGTVSFSGCALNQASVDNILVRLAALDGTGGTVAYSSKTVTLNGGTNSTPSATGLAAKAILVGRGCTVTNN